MSVISTKLAVSLGPTTASAATAPGPESPTVRQGPLPSVAAVHAPSGFKAHRAYLIGINKYSDSIPELTTPENDVDELYKVLSTSHGYTVRKYTGAVDRDALAAVFQRDIHEAGADDRVLIYFAGHGIALEDQDRAGPAGYLVPHGADRRDKDSYVPITDVVDAVNALPCRHVLLVLDCCFAGTVRWSILRDVVTTPAAIPRPRYERYITRRACLVLVSSSADQKALDVFGARRATAAGHSPFAAAVLTALKGDPVAMDFMPLSKRHGVLTTSELFLFVRDQVQDATASTNFNQTPGLWPLKHHDQGEYVHLVPGTKPYLPELGRPDDASNPYRGLNSYEKKDAPFFFGRSAEVDRLVERLMSTPLVVVLGASGVGKSSVIKAGLIPFLEASTDGDWVVLEPFRPGREPLASLENLAIPGVPQAGSSAPARPTTNTLAARVAEWVRQNPGPGGSSRRLLIVVDQLEELFTFDRAMTAMPESLPPIFIGGSREKDRRMEEAAEETRRRFLDELRSTYLNSPDRVRVVATLRSDFAEKFTSFEIARSEEWNKGRTLILPMDRNAYKEAISRPAELSVVFFEPPSLVDELIDEVIDTPGALPLLSFCLAELYRRMMAHEPPDRAMTRQDYSVDLGGVSGALKRKAEEVYSGLPDDDHRQTLRRVMLRMVSATGTETARRRVGEEEFRASDPVEESRVRVVLRSLVDGRLVVIDANDDETVYEPAHDRLLLGWERFQKWVAETQAEVVVLRRLTPDAAAWFKDKKGKADLLWHDDSRLPQLLAKGAAEPSWFNRDEAAFLEASKARRVFKNRVRVTVLSTLGVVAFLAVLAAYQWSAQTEKTRTEKADGYLLAIDHEPPRDYLDDEETGTLRKLSEEQDAGVRMLVLSRAIESPDAARRFTARHAQTIRASVGLDLRRRNQAIAIVMDAFARERNYRRTDAYRTANRTMIEAHDKLVQAMTVAGLSTWGPTTTVLGPGSPRLRRRSSSARCSVRRSIPRARTTI